MGSPVVSHQGARRAEINKVSELSESGGSTTATQNWPQISCLVHAWACRQDAREDEACAVNMLAITVGHVSDVPWPAERHAKERRTAGWSSCQ